MELSSSLPPDLLALADPATRGAASPLAFKQGDARGGGTALPFDLCLELLEPAMPSGETLPLSGNPLPVALDEDAASELDAAETLALALALPGLLPAPIGAAALPAGSADPAAIEAAAASLASGAGPAVAAQNLSSAQQPAAPAVAPSIATEAQDSAPAAAAVAAPNTEATEWLATLADSAAGTVAEAPPETPQAASAARATGDSRATATAASTVATNADYAAEAAVVAPRGETGAVAARRNEEPSRGTARIAWRDAQAVNAGQPSPQATVDTPDVALPTTSPVAAPFVAAMRGDVAAAFATATAPVAEAGSVPGGHSTLHAATAQHSSTTAPTAAAATPDRAPVDTTTPRWQEAFASRVQWLANQNIGEAHIRLNPPELGAVDVKISLVEDRTFVQLTTHTTAARDELAQSLPRLRELFAASGLDLGGASVATGRDGQARNDGASADQPYASRQRFASGGDDAPATTAPARRSAAGASRIDLFA